MKTLKFTLLFFGLIGFSQEKDTLMIKDIEIPNAPALTLLDKSFSIIESVSSANSISANLVNVRDNTVEITPYWFFKEKDHKFSEKEYYGINEDKTQNIFVNLKKIAVSVAYSPTDSMTSISFGFRTNLISIKKGNKSNSAKKLYGSYNEDRNSYFSGKDPGQTESRMAIEMETVGDLGIATTNLTNKYDAQNKELKQKIFKKLKDYYNNPLFSFDVAGAVSSIYPDNQNDRGRIGRIGIWGTTKLDLPLEEEYNNFLKIYLLGRFLNDKTIFNTSLNTYSNLNFIDTGGKIQFQFKSLSISGEFINRSGDVKDNRVVGIIEYKISDSIYLSGGYGKNFDDPLNGNLVTLFGLKWGLFKERQGEISN
jgi:hypothetical protein